MSSTEHQGRRVLLAGDGVEDAPAMTAAHLVSRWAGTDEISR
jgi:cation transport ATPase